MIGIAKGLATTFNNLLHPAITERYPQQVRVLPERSRTSFAFALDENGLPLCKVCGACEKECTDGAITIVSEKPPEGGRRVLKSFQIDLGRCMNCGLCVENCPSDALRHAGDFELASMTCAGTVRVLYRDDRPIAAVVTPPPVADQADRAEGGGA